MEFEQTDIFANKNSNFTRFFWVGGEDVIVTSDRYPAIVGRVKSESMHRPGWYWITILEAKDRDSLGMAYCNELCLRWDEFQLR